MSPEARCSSSEVCTSRPLSREHTSSIGLGHVAYGEHDVTRLAITGIGGVVGLGMAFRARRSDFSVRGLAASAAERRRAERTSAIVLEGDLCDGRTLERVLAGADVVQKELAALSRGEQTLAERGERAINHLHIDNLLDALELVIEQRAALRPRQPRPGPCRGPPRRRTTQRALVVRHSRKDVVEYLRRLILKCSPEISEQIKWSAPSFTFKGDDRVTMRLQPKNHVANSWSVG